MTVSTSAACRAYERIKKNRRSGIRQRRNRRLLRLEVFEQRRLLAGDSTVTGVVFEDINRNGIQDFDEQPAANAAVYLDANDNGQLDGSELSTTTQSNGQYRFDNLDPGSYVVRQDIPQGVDHTAPDIGEEFLFAFDRTTNPDQILRLDPASGAVLSTIPSPVNLNANSIGMAFDGSSLFLADAQTDSVYEVDPTTGSLIDADLISRDIDGAAALNGKLYLSNPFANRIFEFDPVTDTITNEYLVSDGATNVDILGGLAAFENPDQLMATTGTNRLVFFDPATGLVEDSFSHGGESDVGAAAVGQHLHLTYAGPSFFGSVIFERDGGFVDSYVINNGNNNVTVRALAGKRVAETAHRIQLVESETVAGLDFGRFDTRGELGGTKFVDRDGDGQWGPGESPHAGVTVYLDLNDNKQHDPGEPTEITNAQGEYLFDELLPGNYVVREIVPERFQQTAPATNQDIVFGIRFGVSPDVIFQINPLDGSVVRQFSPSYDVTTFRVGLAFDGSSLFVVDQNGDQVVEIDPETGAELDRDSIGPGQYDAIASLNGLLYISDYVADDIKIFDPVSDTVLGILDINGLNGGKNIVGGLAAITDPDELIATTGSNDVVFIDPDTGLINSKFAHGGGTDQGVAVVGDEILMSHTSAFTGIIARERDGTIKRSYLTNFPFYGLTGKRLADSAHRVALGEADSILDLNFGNLPLNQIPVADAGGPYVVNEGDSLTLDASATADGEDDPLTYLWDLDDDGEFDDASGVAPTIDGPLLAALGIADDGVYEISVLVDDGFDTAIAGSTITVANVSPALIVDELIGIGTKAEKATVNDALTISGDFADPGALDSHTVVIDWGEIDDAAANADDDRTVISFAAGDAGLFATDHQYSSGGIFAVTVTLVDDDGGIAVDSSSELWVSGVRLDPNTGELQIVGTSGKDNVSARLIGASDGGSDGRSDGGSDMPQVKVVAKLNAGSDGGTDGGSDGRSDGGADVFYFDPDDVETVRIVLCDGDDHAKLGGSDGGSDAGGDAWYQTSIIEGNAGNDKLTGGSGADLLIGGEGSDKLKGGQGMDLLIGGLGKDNLDGGNDDDLLLGGSGKDKLNGKKGDDLLIGGSTANEDDLVALDAALAHWVDGDADAALDELGLITDDGDKDDLKGKQGIDQLVAGVDDKFKQ